MQGSKDRYAINQLQNFTQRCKDAKNAILLPATEFHQLLNRINNPVTDTGLNHKSGIDLPSLIIQKIKPVPLDPPFIT